MTIFEEDKMLQDKDIYSTERTPSYADWALFNMGKELEEKIPTTTGRTIRSMKVDIIGGDNPLRQPFDTRGGYTYDISIPIEEMAHLLPTGYRFMYNAPIGCAEISNIRNMFLCGEINSTELHIRIQNWYSASARLYRLAVNLFMVKDN